MTEKNIYWIWAPNLDTRIGITEDGELVSTASVITEEDIMNTFIVPKQITDEDLEEFENKEKSDEMEFEQGKLPQKYIDETYKIIDDYYRTIEEYEPGIHPVEPKIMKALDHGPHYIVTPPMIQTDEGAVEKIRDLIAKISKRSQEIMIPQEKIQELYDKLVEAGLTSMEYDTTKTLGNTYFYFNCCGFRWVATTVEHVYMLGGGNITRTRIEVGLSPRNDIDVLMFYKKMKEGKIYVDDLEKFRREFEETLFIIPTKWQSKEDLEKQKARILARVDDYTKEIAYAINKIAAVWRCAME